MRVVVTGGCGFIGHHFVRRWREIHSGDRIIVLDALTYAGDASRIAGLAELVVGDVADPEAVRGAFEAAGDVDVLVHFAAETHVDRSLHRPATFVRTNVLGTQVLLDVARERGVGRFLHVSTDEVYGSIAEDAPPAAEESPFRPGSPYAASKVGADALVTAAFNSFNLPTIVVRPANTFGTGQYPEKLLPVLIRAALRGEPLPLYGDGLHVRDWLAVEDHVTALNLLLSAAAPGSVWNLPGTGGRTNRSVAEAVCVATGVSTDRMQSVADRPGHDRRYAMDGSRLAKLGFSATIKVDDALLGLVAEWRGA
ncbi:dTDP-glucose 4,6-dehydratase [Deltaproteobacteria bacterium]|nr:dTDP-glucose 4,6-dehydratase [Deltaproteobacteria bacterium]